jgi:hypothetical protein
MARAAVWETARTALLMGLLVCAPLAAYSAWAEVRFAAPWGFGLAALVIPLLVLYMLKARRPRRRVASVFLWQAVSRQQQSGSPLQRLRRNLVLALQLAALGGLVYAFARPVTQAAVEESVSLVIVLDTSASMAARDAGGASRFEAARARALELVRGMGPRDEGTLIVVDRLARTRVPWTDDVATLERGVNEAAARDAGTDLGEALLLASSARRAARGRVEVHLLSDGGGPPPPAVELGGALRYLPLGETGENLAVVFVEARPAVGGEDGVGAAPYEVFARVRNAGAQARSVFVGLERAGEVLAARALDVPGRSERPVVLQANLSPGPVAARLLPSEGGQPVDALAVDDVAYTLVPEEEGVLVTLLAPSSSPAVERALEAAGARVQRVAPSGGGPLPSADLYVIEGTPPDPLPSGDCLLIAPSAAVGPVGVGAPVSGVRASAWDREDPLLRFVDLEGLEVVEARGLELGGGARVLVQGEGQGRATCVLAAAWEDGPARRVVVGFDPYRSTWPLRASFPIFVRNCLLAAAERHRLARGGAPAGLPLALPVPAGVTQVEVERPDGETESVGAWGGQVIYGGTSRAGVYTAKAGAWSEAFCVNVGAPDESDLAPRSAADLFEHLGGAPGAEPPRGKRPAEVGRWFVLLALVLLTAELWVYHRRLE